MSFLEEYRKKRPNYEIYITKIQDLIKDFATHSEINLHDIFGRIKTEESLMKKIEEKGKYTNLSEVTDIIGIRVITFFDDDVDALAEIVKKEFEIDEENSIDKRRNDYDRFGYQSLHYIVQLNSNRTSLLEYQGLENVKFEIQIRSILQHAWAEIEHDLGYKSRVEVPSEIRRDFSRISGLLELADKEFIRIKNYLNDYTKSADSSIEKDNLDLEINKVTLREYLLKTDINKEINNYICKTLGRDDCFIDSTIMRENTDILNYFGINSIAELDKILNDKKEKIKSFLNFFRAEHPTRNYDDPNSALSKLALDHSLFFLYYVLVAENYSEETWKDYTQMVSLSKSSYISTRDLILKFINS